MFYSLNSSPVTSSVVVPSTLFNKLFPRTFNLRVSHQLEEEAQGVNLSKKRCKSNHTSAHLTFTLLGRIRKEKNFKNEGSEAFPYCSTSLFSS